MPTKNPYKVILQDRKVIKYATSNNKELKKPYGIKFLNNDLKSTYQYFDYSGYVKSKKWMPKESCVHICRSGWHFITNLRYWDQWSSSKAYLIEYRGTFRRDRSKAAASSIKIIKRITIEEAEKYLIENKPPKPDKIIPEISFKTNKTIGEVRLYLAKTYINSRSWKSISVYLWKNNSWDEWEKSYIFYKIIKNMTTKQEEGFLTWLKRGVKQ